MNKEFNEHIKKSFKYGIKKEKEFANLFKESFEIIYANKHENMFEHWDIKLNNIKIDVKGIKKYKGKLNDTIHYIELVNVRGDSGWLFGDGDGFAFETFNNWIIVEKKELQEFMHDNIIDKQLYTIIQPYKLYQRKNRKDIMTIINTEDLLTLKNIKITK